MKQQWFSVDKQGLGRQAEEQGKGRLVGELVQNALDEPGVTQINVTLAQVPGQALAELTVEDDSAEGFKDLSHVKWTPKTGQSNKLLLAVQERGNHAKETEIPHGDIQGPGGAGSGEG